MRRRYNGPECKRWRKLCVGTRRIADLHRLLEPWCEPCGNYYLYTYRNERKRLQQHCDGDRICKYDTCNKCRVKYSDMYGLIYRAYRNGRYQLYMGTSYRIILHHMQQPYC